MDDNVSLKSSDSVTTSGEYEIVPEMATPTEDNLNNLTTTTPPKLNIANNGDLKDLEKNMTEFIHELDDGTTTIITSTSNLVNQKKLLLPSTSDNECLTLTTPDETPLSNLPITPETNKVGQSVFYDCTEFSSTAEKQDDMKPERSDTDEEMSDIDQDCTVFSGVTYLGAATVNAPKSENEIHRNMAELNGISDAVGLKVSVSIPNCSEGVVV